MIFIRMANSVAVLFVVWATLLIGSAIAYCQFEDAAILDALYWSVVTATTLGYGDISPHSGGGKLLTAFLISVTIFFLIPTITANLASKLIVDHDIFTHQEQEEIKASLRELLRRTEGSTP